MASRRESSPPHRGRVHLLELVNFKSYRGVVTVGPFRPFTAIVGPNGAGKSNVMDAISFVLGVRTEQLRGKLRELLHYDGARTAPRGHVKLVFEEATGRHVEFCRAILPPRGVGPYTSEYRVDAAPVSTETYLAKLQSYGVLVKARNFLVFQGDIESVAAMRPKELTRMFEFVSGSYLLAKEHEKLSAAKEAAEQELMQLYGRKKSLLAEARQKKGQIAEARKHRSAEEALNRERLTLCAWKIYLFEREVATLAEERRRGEAAVQEEGRKRDVAEGAVQAKRRALADLTERIAEGEQRLLALQKEAELVDPASIRIAEERSRVEKRRKGLQKKHDDAKNRLDDWTRHVEKLKADSAALQSAYRRFEEGVAAEEGEGLRLSGADLDAYQEIQNRVLAVTGRLQQEKSVLDATQTTAREALTRLKSREETLQTEAENAQRAEEILRGKEEATRREGREIEQKRQETLYARAHLEQTIQQETAQRDALILKGDELDREIAEGKAMRRETRRDAAVAESIENMKRLISGIYGRVTSLGKVRQPKYNLAMAVALGGDLDSVVVDSRETAKTCIQYLKDHRRQPLTFLPLDSIHAKPVQERLRRLGGSAKLAMDVLNFDRKFEKGFQFVCNNAIVCDTIDEAKTLAYQHKAPPPCQSLCNDCH